MLLCLCALLSLYPTHTHMHICYFAGIEGEEYLHVKTERCRRLLHVRWVYAQHVSKSSRKDQARETREFAALEWNQIRTHTHSRTRTSEKKKKKKSGGERFDQSQLCNCGRTRISIYSLYLSCACCFRVRLTMHRLGIQRIRGRTNSRPVYEVCHHRRYVHANVNNRTIQ